MCFIFLDSDEDMIGPPLPPSMKAPVTEESEEMIGPPLPPPTTGGGDDSDEEGEEEEDVSTTTRIVEPCHEKTCLRDVRPGPTQTGLYSHRR